MACKRHRWPDIHNWRLEAIAVTNMHFPCSFHSLLIAWGTPVKPKEGHWVSYFTLQNLPISYRYVAACSLGTCVYVIGGFDGGERLNTVGLLDVAQREDGWRWLAPMHYKRGLSAACTHKGIVVSRALFISRFQHSAHIAMLVWSHSQSLEFSVRGYWLKTYYLYFWTPRTLRLWLAETTFTSTMRVSVLTYLWGRINGSVHCFNRLQIVIPFELMPFPFDLSNYTFFLRLSCGD